MKTAFTDNHFIVQLTT